MMAVYENFFLCFLKEGDDKVGIVPGSYTKIILNKKVLLRECKRHTARRIASTRCGGWVVPPGGGYPIPRWGTPHLGRGTPISWMGYPHLDLGWGTPHLDLGWGTPPPGPGMGYPLCRLDGVPPHKWWTK